MKMEMVYGLLIANLLLLIIICYKVAYIADILKQMNNRVLYQAKRMGEISLEFGKIKTELGNMKYKAKKKEDKKKDPR